MPGYANDVNTKTISDSSATLPPVSVMFDVDGTLCNSCELAFENTNLIFQKEGLPTIDKKTYHYATRFSTPRRFAWHVTGNADDDSGIGERLAKEFDDTYVKLVSKRTAGLFPGLFEEIRALQADFQNLTLGALTNGAGAFCRAVLKTNELDDIFAFGLGADDVPASKPSPLGLLKCAGLINLAPSSCIYVGDSPTDGMAATAAGMMSVGVTWGSYPREALEGNFTCLVDTPAEMRRVLSRMLAEKMSRHESKAVTLSQLTQLMIGSETQREKKVATEVESHITVGAV